MRRFLKIVGGVLGVVVIVLIGGIVYILNIDLNDWKPEIEEAARDATGRDLTIGGPIEFNLGTDTSLKLTDIVLSNADWGSRPNMVEVDSVDIEFKLFSLLGSSPDITRIHVDGVRAIVEKNPAGVSNTDFGGEPAPKETSGGGDLILPIIRDLRIAGVEVVISDPAAGPDKVFTLTELSLASQSESDPLMLTLDAAFDDLALVMGGSMGSLQTMTDSSSPTPVDFTGNLAGIDVAVKGQIQDMAGQDGIDVTISAFGEELAEAAKIAGIDVPSLGGFKVDATLKGSGSALSVDPLLVDIGSSDIIHAAVSGRIDNAISQEGIDLSVLVESSQIGNLSPISQSLAGQDVPALGPLTLNLAVRGGMDSGIAAENLALSLGSPEMLALSVTGGIADLMRQEGIELAISGNSPELGTLSPVTEKLSGQKMPDIGPLALSAKVSGDAQGVLGISDILVDIGRPEMIKVLLDGGLADLKAMSGANLNFKVTSPDLSVLSALAGSPVPPIGPLDLSGSIQGDQGKPISLDPFTATIGGSDVSGTATIDATGSVPDIKAKLSSTRFDLKDVTPESKAGSGSSTASSGSGSSGGTASDGRLIPNDPLPLDVMKSLNADISYTAGTFVATVAEMTDLEIKIALNNGALTISPFKAGIGEGSFNGTISLDGSQTNAPLSVLIEGKQMGLDSLLAGAGMRDKIIGPVDVAIDLKGVGATPRALAGSLNGSTQVSMYDSRIQKKAFEEAMGETLASLLASEGGWIVVDCAVFDYDIADGLMNTKAGYTASGPITVATEGTISLKTEQLDLKAKPAGGGLASVPMLVTGTFANPSVVPDPVSIGLGVVTGLLTGGMGNALLAIVADLPEGHPCKKEVAESKEQAESSPSSSGGVGGAVEDAGKAVEEGVGGALKGLFGN